MHAFKNSTVTQHSGFLLLLLNVHICQGLLDQVYTPCQYQSLHLTLVFHFVANLSYSPSKYSNINTQLLQNPAKIQAEILIGHVMNYKLQSTSFSEHRFLNSTASWAKEIWA